MARKTANGTLASERTRSAAPRTLKGAERAQQIMEIAEKLFHKQGYAQTSMDDIGRAAGLLKGSLYYYMDSKEDLLFRIVEDVHEVSRAQLDDARRRDELPATDRLMLFVEAQVTYLARNVTRVAVYHHEWHRLEGDRLRNVREARHAYDEALISLLEEVQRDGDIAVDVDPRIAANMVLAAICWPYTWYRPGAISPSALAHSSAQFVRGGLADLRPIT
jgi:AcrR family transcriptional regulator